jgi:hypothetical protein
VLDLTLWAARTAAQLFKAFDKTDSMKLKAKSERRSEAVSFDNTHSLSSEKTSGSARKTLTRSWQ